MDRRVVGEGYVVPLGLLPSPTVPRPFAILFRTDGCRLGYAAASLPPRRRVRPLASVRHCRVCTRVRHVRHVSCTSHPRLRLLLYQRFRGLPPRRPVSYIRKRLLRRSLSHQLRVIRLRGIPEIVVHAYLCAACHRAKNRRQRKKVELPFHSIILPDRERN